MSPYQGGDTWFRDMREPGFNGETAPSADNSLQWLAQKIVEDERFARAAVRFWWPPIMGVELAEPAEDSSDSDFEALRLASAAQTLEVDALADAFREGIEGGEPYNGKDFLAEIALSPWFRAESYAGEDEVRAAALRDAGVARLLTPEELVSKTEALTGYVWGRRFSMPFGRAETRSNLNPRVVAGSYGLLYGGIDSDGITERTGDMTPLMAAVAQSHAAEMSCPIVRREFYYWPDGNRLLFNGVSESDTPHSETFGGFDVKAESWETRETVALEVPLAAGSKTIRLAYTNNRVEGEDSGDRNLGLDRLIVRDSRNAVVSEIELEFFDSQGCGGPREQFYKMIANCSLQVPVGVAFDGDYSVLVVAHQDKAGDEDARLEITVEAGDGSSRGAMAIRRKLADLHHQFFGVTVMADSPDVNEAHNLFLEVWNRKRSTEGRNFFDSRFQCNARDDQLYFEGLVADVLQFSDRGNSYVNYDPVQEFDRGIAKGDPHHTVRTWVVVLAYLLTDYRYLYF